MMSLGPLLLMAAGIVAMLAIFGKRWFGASKGPQVLVMVTCVIGVAFALLRPMANVGGPVPHARVTTRSHGVSVDLSQPARIEAAPAVPPVPRVESVEVLYGDNRSEGTGARGGIISLASLAGFVALTYLFIDAGRHGRYTWAIRAGSAAAFVGLCMLLLSMGPLASPGL
jgi:hypothetical protein